MEQKSLSRLLKGIVAGAGICGLIIYLILLPYIGQGILADYPEFSDRYYPWLVFLWITGIPCYVALFFGWQIAESIGRDESFTNQNAQRLKKISYLAIGDAAFFFIGNLVYLCMNMNHPGVVIFSLFVVFVGIVISVIAAALSHLVKKAAVLQEESDLTI
ncbi:MAG: DUF2975 domain-containing protein [Lachnospiraceae bacterium]|nr:DUF2975 domain-containing protein [Lachnospiraceae bacterium]